jgi:DNA-binding GntR family transcriptional regulator
VNIVVEIDPLTHITGDHAAGRVHAHLRRLILEAVIPPGTIVTQVELAARLGVSRTPIREAIRMLQEEGLVVAEPQKRARVIGFDPAEVAFWEDVPRAWNVGAGEHQAIVAAFRERDRRAAAAEVAAHLARTGLTLIVHLAPQANPVALRAALGIVSPEVNLGRTESRAPIPRRSADGSARGV